jgi:hypothetical protein
MFTYESFEVLKERVKEKMLLDTSTTYASRHNTGPATVNPTYPLNHLQPAAYQCSGACKKEQAEPSRQRVTKWQFKAPSNTLIQLDKIARELSYAHPIAFTSRQKSNSHIVMLHPSLVFKARTCKLELPFEVANASQIMSYYLVLRTTSEGLHAIIRWVKLVKAASFPHREPNETVTVTLL